VSADNIFNMPSGVPFLPALATGLKAMFPDSLQNGLILLPTRRAVRSLGAAFVTKGSASLLPRMRPLADIDPDEPPFEPGELAGLVKPVIAPMQRRFELATLVRKYHQRPDRLPLDSAGTLSLVDPLIAILNDAAMEEASLNNLSKLKEVQEFAAQHFQEAAVFYEIIQTYWPKRLAELDVMEPMQRRVALLQALDDVWEKNPPQYPVIIAGSTGTLRATRQLIHRVSQLPQGLIILPGLDKNIRDDAVWKNISDQHPQNSLKRLIESLGVNRADVKDWAWANPGNPAQMRARRQIISESLVPADSTSDWPSRIERIKAGAPDNNPFKLALKGLSVMEARTDEEEALAITLIMRETLETKDKTAVLVTPDPALARRVRARLRRWGVNVDYSQGEPLEETALGGFLSGLVKLAQDPTNPVDLAFICKHPLSALGSTQQKLRQDWNRLERNIFRGIRPDAEKIKSETADTDTAWIIDALVNVLKPFSNKIEMPASIWAENLVKAAEIIATTEESHGAGCLWVQDVGEKAAALLQDLIDHGDILGPITLQEFGSLLADLMRGRVVRPRFGTHPKLSILGPLEARILEADLIILGSLNEGLWPARPSIEPFLSQGMRKTLGLSLPERRFGLAAHDFAELAANPNVILTRSERSDDSPAIASRWLWRLQILMGGALGEAEADIALSGSNHYLDWARALDDVPATEVKAATPPEPRPNTEDRWLEPWGRQLSITQVRTWIRDPYSIYAKHVLGLEPLEALDMPIGVREYGNAIHDGLEKFIKAYMTSLPPNPVAVLTQTFQHSFAVYGYADFEIAKEQARLNKISQQLIDWIQQRRLTGWQVLGAEKKGKTYLSDMNFTLSGKADLLETGPYGYAVTDYKTGAPATVKLVKAGFDPQLPLTAFMLAQGNFDNINPGDTAELNYIRIKGAGETNLVNSLTPPAKGAVSAPEYSAAAIHTLKELIAAFDKPETAYYSQPRIQYTHDYGHYDHLARRDEWARLGGEV